MKTLIFCKKKITRSLINDIHSSKYNFNFFIKVLQNL